MKKHLIAALSILALGFLGTLIPAKAQAKVTCNKVLNNGAYPEGYLWDCNPAANSFGGQAATVLGRLGSNAKMQLKTASPSHYIFLFAQQSDYVTYCNQPASVNNPAPSIPSSVTSPCTAPSTIHFGDTYFTSNMVYSAIWEDIIGKYPVNVENVANTAAHEVGHQLDSIYGALLYGGGAASQEQRDMAFRVTGEIVTIYGTAVPGDVITLNFFGNALGNVTVPVSYTVRSNDTSDKIADALITAINNTTALTTTSQNYVHVQASKVGTALIKITSGAALSYSSSVTHGSGPNYEQIGLSRLDWQAFSNRSPKCAGPVTGSIFSGQIDSQGKYICSSLQTINVAGTPHSGDTLTIKVSDTLLPSPHYVNVTYTVPVTPTPTQASIAAGIAAAINGNITLQNNGITAQSSGVTVSISDSSNDTGFSVATTVTGTETLTLGYSTAQNGHGYTPAYGYLNTTNIEMLRQAWSYYFIPSTGLAVCNSTQCWRELFAEETAVILDAPTTQQSPDTYLTPSFVCSKAVVEGLEANGTVPAIANPCN